MNRGLVVIDDPDTEPNHQLLREAAEHASGANTDLVLLTLLDEEKVEHDVETLSSIGSVEDVNYDAETILTGARDDLEGMAQSVLEGFDVEIDTEAAVGDGEVETILDLADRRGCDHVFLLGRRRSPAGKAVFGDRAQQVILNFDGYVTVATE